MSCHCRRHFLFLFFWFGGFSVVVGIYWYWLVLMVLGHCSMVRRGALAYAFWRYIYKYFYFLVFLGHFCLTVGTRGFANLCVCGLVLCGWQ